MLMHSATQQSTSGESIYRIDPRQKENDNRITDENNCHIMLLSALEFARRAAVAKESFFSPDLT